MRSRFTPVWKYFHVLNKWTLSLIPNTKSCVKDLISYRIVHGDFTSWACCARHHVVGIVNCHGIVIEIIPQGQIDRYFTHALQTLIVKKIFRSWDRLKFGSSNNHERCDYLPIWCNLHSTDCYAALFQAIFVQCTLHCTEECTGHWQRDESDESVTPGQWGQ